MAEEESLSLEEQAPKKKSPLMLIIVAVVVLLLAGGGTFWFLSGDDSASEQKMAMENGDEMSMEEKPSDEEAIYVPMPGRFLFNLSSDNGSVLVQIQVQLMVRGEDNAIGIKKHIPLVKSELLNTFSGSNALKLSTQAGKDELRQQAAINVQNALLPIMGNKAVERVLFTGFVMQ
ncbi:flagellar basal body-associated protein FliL [Parashewanella spongiae]|uniref:Flagellar protein FliL n=1 Tax=Parashewanella spongiae TaxID=342950 RepID=A0A3A6UP28_9GAMM|nr:flagellar basal body-associated protein FliL [Parashewanella spongiae]MCL1076638.1 flagellar basal body-associated protein FliL [Parashewanella spongiae]RJY19591.1 flagellar basal body-associated protein FliL [Parashewanella spongiae]